MDYSKFEKLCEANGVTAYRVAKETGISQATLSNWKKGNYTPKLDKMKRIADYFNVSVDYFQDEKPVVPEGYYLDEETAKVAQQIFEDPNLRILFSAARDAKPEDLLMAARMLKKFKGDED